ncbi:hypothetical protein BC567DRAFT_277813 [Phyllosticta citribraziliensis]
MASVRTKTDTGVEDLASYFKRINFDLDLSPSARKPLPKLKPVTANTSRKAISAASSKPRKASSVAPSEASQGFVKYTYHSSRRLSPSASSFVPSRPIKGAQSPADPFQDSSPVDPTQGNTPVDPRYEALGEQEKRLLAILKSPRGSQQPFQLIQNESPTRTPPVVSHDSETSPCSVCPYDTATCPCPLQYAQFGIEEFAVESDLTSRHVTPEFEVPGSIDLSKSPSYTLPISALPHTLRSSSIDATMPPLGNLFGLGNSRYAPSRPSSLYNPLNPVSADRTPPVPLANEEDLQQQSALQADLQRQAQLKREAEQAAEVRLIREQEERERQRLAKFKADKEEMEWRLAEARRAAQFKREQEERERQRLAKIQAEKVEAERREREERARRAAQLKREEEERERQRLAKLKAEKEEAERREREERARRAAQLKREQEERERERLAKLKAEKEEAELRERFRRQEEAKRAQLKRQQEERERLAKIQAEKEEAERKERERQLLLQAQRIDAIGQIEAYVKDSSMKYGILMKQTDDEIDQQASDLESFNDKIAAKKTEYAKIEQQLKNLGVELQGMAAAKVGMDKDLRQLVDNKTELLSAAQKVRNEAAEKTKTLKEKSLSSNEVAKILEFIKPEFETPEVELSRLSLSDKPECSDDDSESSGNEDGFVDLGATPAPAYWKLDDTGVEADRVVKLVNLPTNITVVTIQALVWGGPLDRIVYTPGESTAEIHFLIGQDCQKYYKATANHIPFPGNEERLVRVEKCPPSPRHPFLRYAWEEKLTRYVLATGIPEGWTKAELKKFAGSHNREVEQVLFGKDSSGKRLCEFRFLNIFHANAFKFLMKRDIDFYKVKTEYSKDQCAVHRGVHTQPR